MAHMAKQTKCNACMCTTVAIQLKIMTASLLIYTFQEHVHAIIPTRNSLQWIRDEAIEEYTSTEMIRIGNNLVLFFVWMISDFFYEMQTPPRLPPAAVLISFFLSYWCNHQEGDGKVNADLFHRWRLARTNALKLSPRSFSRLLQGNRIKETHHMALPLTATPICHVTLLQSIAKPPKSVPERGIVNLSEGRSMATQSKCRCGFRAPHRRMLVGSGEGVYIDQYGDHKTCVQTRHMNTFGGERAA